MESLGAETGENGVPGASPSAVGLHPLGRHLTSGAPGSLSVSWRIGLHPPLPALGAVVTVR